MHAKSIYNVLRKLKTNSSVVNDILKALISLSSVNAVSSLNALLVPSFSCVPEMQVVLINCACLSVRAMVLR